jgi:hypothetical protein
MALGKQLTPLWVLPVSPNNTESFAQTMAEIIFLFLRYECVGSECYFKQLRSGQENSVKADRTTIIFAETTAIKQ